MKTGNVDIATIGYPAVREAFNETLQLCVDKLAKKDLTLAHEILGPGELDEEEPKVGEMLADLALYSRKERPGGPRAIDRIAPKLPVKRDPLKSTIAEKLPNAFFTVLEVEGPHEQGGVLAWDLLDDERSIHIMDKALAAQAVESSDIRLAGRFLDVGPWHIGFGIIQTLRKSEALAICLALSSGEEPEAQRDNLHELIYPASLHGDNLVMTALEPMIMALAMGIDMDMIDAEDILGHFGAALPDEPDPW